MADVETSIYPFQVALWVTNAKLPKVVQSHVLFFESIVVHSYFQMQSSLKEQLHA
jgi:hypothetical protein